MKTINLCMLVLSIAFEASPLYAAGMSRPGRPNHISHDFEAGTPLRVVTNALHEPASIINSLINVEPTELTEHGQVAAIVTMDKSLTLPASFIIGSPDIYAIRPRKADDLEQWIAARVVARVGGASRVFVSDGEDTRIQLGKRIFGFGERLNQIAKDLDAAKRRSRDIGIDMDPNNFELYYAELTRAFDIAFTRPKKWRL